MDYMRISGTEPSLEILCTATNDMILIPLPNLSAHEK